ncbi:MAG: hypothetical protein ACJAWH_002176 [Maribacter sp.]|jgi:hypothetical protein
MKLEKTLTEAFSDMRLRAFYYVRLACNENSVNEYETSSTPDFKNRGVKAVEYSKFIIEEFIPFVRE